MKFGDFLSDEAKQALYEIQKNQSNEIFDKIDDIRNKGYEQTSSNPKAVKQNSNKDSATNPCEKGRKIAEERKRRAFRKKEKKIEMEYKKKIIEIGKFKK